MQTNKLEEIKAYAIKHGEKFKSGQIIPQRILKVKKSAFRSRKVFTSDCYALPTKIGYLLVSVGCGSYAKLFNMKNTTLRGRPYIPNGCNGWVSLLEYSTIDSGLSSEFHRAIFGTVQGDE